MGDAYPYLVERRDGDPRASSRARRPSSRGRSMPGTRPARGRRSGPLASGERVIGRSPEDLPADAPVLPGDVAFRLHDTYGFPIDLTVELAAEYGVRVDREGFDAALAEQRQRSRTGTKAELARHAELDRALPGDPAAARGETPLPGLRDHQAEARVVAILRDGIEYEELTGHGEAEIVLDRTPFYGEGGGQVGDRGVLREPGGGSVLFDVEDTQKPIGRAVRAPRHAPRPAAGRRDGRRPSSTPSGAPARCATTPARTCSTARCATWSATRPARPARSSTPDYLRFDFPLDRALTDDEKRAIEDEVRRIVREDRPVTIAFMTHGRGDRGRRRRVLRREVRRDGPHRPGRGLLSFELCGGTHCRASRPDRRLRHHRRAEHRVGHAPHRGRDRRRGRRPACASASPLLERVAEAAGRPDARGGPGARSRRSRRSCARRGAGSRRAPARRSPTPGELVGARRGGRAGRPARGLRRSPFDSIEALKGVREGPSAAPSARA